MVEINFLPWRVHLYEYNKKKIYYVVIAILSFLFILSLLLYAWVNIQLHEKNNIIIGLQKKLSFLHKRSVYIKHNDAQFIWNVITAFQNNQVQWAQFFQEFIQLTPEGIFWDSMVVEDKQMIVVGNTSSFPLLLDFVNRFDKNQNASQTDIIKIQSVPHSDFFQFSLRFSNRILPLSLRLESYD